MKPCDLTPELQHQIAVSIRSGCYGHVAAEAWGVPRRLFQSWLRRGRRKNAPEPYAGFAAEIRTAMAQARLRAEVDAYQKDAKAWLEHGPGRETAENPGWTGAVKAPASAVNAAAELLLQPRILEICNLVLQVLLPFPEARTRVADALFELNKGKTAA